MSNPNIALCHSDHVLIDFTKNIVITVCRFSTSFGSGLCHSNGPRLLCQLDQHGAERSRAIDPLWKWQP
jgi:hypothetical protein